MSPLFKGPGNVRKNVAELMNSPIVSPARKKAIATIARQRGVSLEEARFIQARRIAQVQGRKR